MAAQAVEGEDRFIPTDAEQKLAVMMCVSGRSGLSSFTRIGRLTSFDKNHGVYVLHFWSPHSATMLSGVAGSDHTRNTAGR